MFRRKGQSTVEYALVIAIVVAGLLAMQFYVKRGYSGRLKSSADDMGDSYDPQKYNATFSVLSQSDTKQEMTKDTSVKTTYNSLPGYAGFGRVQSKTGSEKVDAWTATDELASQ